MATQARTEFAAAINQIASEKGVEPSIIIDAIKQAALAAYRKDLSFRNEPVPEDLEELEVKLDGASGEISIFRGEENITPPGFARIAAQTAKQVITQKLHEAEKGAIVDEYEQKVGTVISGNVQRQEGNTYFVDLGRAEGVLPPSEQVRDEYYGQNQRMKFFIKEIRETNRGPEVVVSRADAGLVKGLFALEVPEIQSGAVSIQEIAREAGGRCKVAVSSTQDGIDPVGSARRQGNTHAPSARRDHCAMPGGAHLLHRREQNARTHAGTVTLPSDGRATCPEGHRGLVGTGDDSVEEKRNGVMWCRWHSRNRFLPTILSSNRRLLVHD